MKQLYLITDDDENGENRDLFVWADDPMDAARFWDEYYGSVCFPCSVLVREVPTTGKRGAVSWDDVKRHQVIA